MVKIKVVPTPYFELHEIYPPKDYTIILDMCKPRPIPSGFNLFVDFNFPKSSNNLSCSSSFIPIPESFTVISIIPCSAFSNDYTKLLS